MASSMAHLTSAAALAGRRVSTGAFYPPDLDQTYVSPESRALRSSPIASGTGAVDRSPSWVAPSRPAFSPRGRSRNPEPSPLPPSRACERVLTLSARSCPPSFHRCALYPPRLPPPRRRPRPRCRLGALGMPPSRHTNSRPAPRNMAPASKNLCVFEATRLCGHKGLSPVLGWDLSRLLLAPFRWGRNLPPAPLFPWALKIDTSPRPCQPTLPPSCLNANIHGDLHATPDPPPEPSFRLGVRVGVQLNTLNPKP